MKKIIAICFILCGLTKLFAQDGTSKNDTGKVYDFVELPPQFSGDMIHWLADHINYPETAYDHSIQGTVFVGFVVNREGVVQNPKILKGVPNGQMLDSEAIRVVLAMPKWQPGYQSGKAVNVNYRLPIKFMLKIHSAYDTTQTIRESDTGENAIYTYVDEPPVFLGDFDKWLSKNAKYPDSAKLFNIEGDVTVRFVVEKDGSVSNFMVAKSAVPILDGAAIKIASKIPKWRPGTNADKPVRTLRSLHLEFNLQPAPQITGVLRSVTDDVGDTNRVYSSVLHEPEPGYDLETWLTNGIPGLVKIQEKEVGIKVWADFIVEKDGSITNIKIERFLGSGNSDLDVPIEQSQTSPESLKFKLSQMPKWRPGYNIAGKPLRVKYRYPLYFRRR